VIGMEVGGMVERGYEPPVGDSRFPGESELEYLARLAREANRYMSQPILPPADEQPVAPQQQTPGWSILPIPGEGFVRGTPTNPKVLPPASSLDVVGQLGRAFSGPEGSAPTTAVPAPLASRVSAGPITTAKESIIPTDGAPADVAAPQNAPVVDFGPKDDFAFRNLIRAGAAPGAPQGAQPELAGMGVTKQYDPTGTVITALADKAGKFNDFSGTGKQSAGNEPYYMAAAAKLKEDVAAQNSRINALLAKQAGIRAGTWDAKDEALMQDAQARGLAARAAASYHDQARELTAEAAPLAAEEMRQKLETGRITLEQFKIGEELLKAATNMALSKAARDEAAQRWHQMFHKGSDKGDFVFEKTGGGVDPTTMQANPQRVVRGNTRSGDYQWLDEAGRGNVVTKADFAVMSKRLGGDEAARKFLASKNMTVE